MPEVASRHHLELVNPIVDAALAEAGVELGDVDALAVTRGPGLIGALLVGVSTAKALAAAAGKPLVGVDHLHGHVAANFLEPDPIEPPVPLPDRERRPHAARRGHRAATATRSSARRSTTPPARRSTRRRGCSASAIPAARRSSARRAAATRGAFEFPVAMAQRPAARLQLQRPEDGAALRGPRARRRGARRAPRRPRGELPGGGRRPARREAAPRARGGDARRAWDAVALGGGVAANALLRERVAELCASRGPAR